MHLVWSVLVFQAKLVADGMRDVLLVPISLVAALVGLVGGGTQPGKYFDQVIRFGRRTETWINLFGQRDPEGTADEILNPIRERVFEEADSNPLLYRAGEHINRSLDSVNESVANANKPKSQPADATPAIEDK